MLLREGRRPLNWDLRGRIDQELMRETLSTALRSDTPGATRHVLKYICGDAIALLIKDEIEQLAATHGSEVVRWKARQTCSAMENPGSETPAPRPEWIRLDATILMGAPKSVARKNSAQPKKEEIESAGRGLKLHLETLKGRSRCDAIRSILSAPLKRALHRRAPFGPAYEARKSGQLPYLRPDGKTQVTVEYDARRGAERVRTVVVSAQHDPDVRAERLRGEDRRVRDPAVRSPWSCGTPIRSCTSTRPAAS